ncbi:MAG TPA: HD domain-containing phosphohydrolase [Rectinemataceae bacterium]|nr:HD domain-containing phosphohydrolase [Rectinemataceae bacterium]
MHEAPMKENKTTIMVVDDTPENLVLISRMLLPEGYRVMTLPDGRMAIDAIKTNPPDLVLLDVMMPGLDGFAVCSILKADPLTASIPVIFISALSEPLDKVKAFESGAVDYITKPFNLMEVKARVGVHLELRSAQKALEDYSSLLEKKVKEQVEELSAGQLTLITAMTKLVEARDDATGRHIERTQTLCRLLAERLGGKPGYRETIDPGFIEDIYNASPLHDIGKVAIKDSILLKPGKLLPEEYEIMKTHTTIGKEYLCRALAKSPKNKYLRMGMEIAGSHHEKWDGSGYPEGLVGEAIPLCARIMALVDVYDALRSTRLYKEAYPHAQTLAMIVQGRGGHFDPAVVDAFLEISEAFDRARSEMDELSPPADRR